MKKELLSAALAVVLALPSCQVATMAVNDGLKAQSEELPVAGRRVFKPNGSFSIGPYTVANVHRGWRQSSGFSIFSYENVKSQQKYEFSLQDGKGEEWYIFGAARLHEKALVSDNGISIALSPNNEYYASYFTSPESGAWHLITVDPGHYLQREKFDGALTNGRTRYRVEPVYKFEGKNLPSSDIVGYEFVDGDQIVAALQVINNGKVWMKPELSSDTRMVLASAMASLLLYDKLNSSDTELARN